MALEKITGVDMIEVVENGNVQVRIKTAIIEDGQQISGTYHRHIIHPGECGDDEDPRVKAVCSAVHTPEMIAAYRAEQARLAAQTEIPQKIINASAAAAQII